MVNYDDLLNNKLSDLQNGASLDEVLQSLPDEAKELEGLLRLASAVSETQHPEPLAETIHLHHHNLTAEAPPSEAVSPNGFSRNGIGNAASYQPTLPAAKRPAPRSIPRTAALPWKWLGAGAFAVGSAALVFLFVAAAALSLLFSGRGYDSAQVENVTGQVQIASGQSAWKNIGVGDHVRQGDRLRTLGASSATLVFFEGTHTFVSPNSELHFVDLDGSKGGTLRVKIDQQAGETYNKVTPFGAKQSSFLVQTPSGTASVHGTSFNVKVTQTGQAQFSVDTGEVRVANAGREVTLLAGQATSANPLGDIASPNYQFSISGSLSDIDLTTGIWTVSGLDFLVDENTLINGAPEIGDSLHVTGRILSDGTRVADTIDPAADSDLTASFTGSLESNDGPVWTISSMPVTVDGSTELAGDLTPGTPVKVTFNLLEDGTWLALKIEALLEDPEEPAPTPTATSDPNAMPSYEFDPDEIEVPACETNDFNVTGTLRNTSDEVKDYAANVKLGYLIDRGGEYISSVELSPTGWTRIDAGQTLTFNIRVRMNEAWASAPEDSEVKLRIHIASATNRPDHLNGRLTVTIISRCDDPTPTPEVTSTATLTPTITATAEPTVTGTLPPTPTPTLATPTALPTETGLCTGADPHPTGMKLAQRYGVPYEEIMYWFCQHFGFGEIDLAYSLSRQTGTPVEEIFAMKSSGMGWGNIKKSLLQGEKPGKPENPSGPGNSGKPENPGRPGNPGKPDKPGKP